MGIVAWIKDKKIDKPMGWLIDCCAADALALSPYQQEGLLRLTWWPQIKGDEHQDFQRQHRGQMTDKMYK